MKQFIYVILFSISITAFAVHGFSSESITEMVVALPELDSREMQRNLEIDISRLPGIKFFEASLSSQTLMLNYDSNKLSKEAIDGILKKWGCSPGDFSFRSAVSMK